MINRPMLYERRFAPCPRCGSRLACQRESPFTRDFASRANLCLRCGGNTPFVHERGSGGNGAAAGSPAFPPPSGGLPGSPPWQLSQKAYHFKSS